MPPKKDGRRKTGKGKANASSVPDVYREMLAEAIPAQPELPERPQKRRRIGRRDVQTAVSSSAKAPDPSPAEEEEELEFEDVLYNKDLEKFDEASSSPAKQTAYRDSDASSTDSEHSDGDWDPFDFEAMAEKDESSGDIELTLTTNSLPPQNLGPSRRRAVTKAEKITRLETHKLHILCLLSHLDRRNNWCNDAKVHTSLKPLIDKKMLKFLRPGETLSQFGRAESIKRGLEMVSAMWRQRFEITARGMRRALWADDKEHLQNYKLPDDADAACKKSDFQEAAKKLKGSRDLGAQLYCALLRSVEVEARLVCSLQPLSFNASGPPMPRPPTSKKAGGLAVVKKPEATNLEDSYDRFSAAAARRRLGHPNAADYYMPEMGAAQPSLIQPKVKIIEESHFPIFWTEVFDEAHQKWFPVDPLVTETVAKPRAFEPPASDKENSMSYVIAFEEESCARDVTRRYTKAYNAKTRKSRVESTPRGDKWWRKVMRSYFRGFTSDADQIEDTEFALVEAREPMPKSIQDFKDHPYYALERHLKRNEVLLSTREAGKVTAGKGKLENVYRRQHVRVVKSADAWYRLGREIKLGEQPLKTVAAKRRPDEDDMGDDLEERAGTNLYSEDQTELYVAPPIVNGRVPRNSYGNLDVFVPSMVPPGGAHIPHDQAHRAAKLLGIDYAAALTGFNFQGRHGTAVFSGVVVAQEYREAMEAVIQGFVDEHESKVERARSLAALIMWKKFLKGLRIKERVDSYAVEGEEDGNHAAVTRSENRETEYQESDNERGLLPDEEGDDDNGGRGFFSEGDESPDDGDLAEGEDPVDDEGGGFIPE